MTEAAALLPPVSRDGFLRSVAAVLDCEHPSDGEVLRALRFVLSERGVAVGKLFFASKCGASATTRSSEGGRERVTRATSTKGNYNA